MRRRKLRFLATLAEKLLVTSKARVKEVRILDVSAHTLYT